MPFVEPGKKIDRSDSYKDSLALLAQVLQSSQMQQQAQEPVYQNFTQEDIGIPAPDEDLSDFEVDPETMPWSTEARQSDQMSIFGTTTEIENEKASQEAYAQAMMDGVITPEEQEGLDFLMRKSLERQQMAETAPEEVTSTDPVQQAMENPNLINGIDVDVALKAIGYHESGSKGEAKLGMPTSMRGSASGTFQITDQTKLDIYQKNFKDQYRTFEDFKHAFNTDPNVEYNAAKSLMSDHARNYGEYALGAWYYPEYARRAKNGDLSVMDSVPRPDYKNRLTWGQDFNKKRGEYYKLLEQQNASRQQVANGEPQNEMIGPPEDFKPVVKSADVDHRNLDARLKSWYNSQSEQYGDLMITSANDSKKHVEGSKHYENKAIDVRFWDPAGAKLKQDVENKGKFVMSTKRGPVYAFNGVNVLIEKDHLHISI
jgi:hypothetical protein